MGKAKAHGRALAALTVMGVWIGITGLPAVAQTEIQYTQIPQSQMTAIAADSTETSGEGSNGPIEKVLDGDSSTYWHTRWVGTIDPLPHWFVIQLNDTVENLARVDLLARQSSNGSGRAGNYEVRAIETESCTSDAFNDVAAVATGSKAADDPYNEPWQVTFAPMKANCIKVTYTSSWGGNNSAEKVATLSEFTAYTGVEVEVPDPEPATPLTIETPEQALTITDGVLTVTTHPKFPQVVKYSLGEKEIAGKFGDALTSVLINEQEQNVTVGEAKRSDDGRSVTYPITFPNLEGASFDAVLSVDDAVLTYTLTNIKDPNRVLDRISIPNLDLVSVQGTDETAEVFAANIETNRAKSGDVRTLVKDSTESSRNAWSIVTHDSNLAAGFATNAIGDNCNADGSCNNAKATNTARFTYRFTQIDGTKVGTVGPASWTWRPNSVKTYGVSDEKSDTSIGVEQDPYIKVKITADANDDSVVDWQDGAIAGRSILPQFVGMDDTWKYVITRIPFNIVSQATHPFLRTLDDTKRIALATDNLGQQVLLKGYQAEGHDSAQGDYGGHYNEKAGGLEDMKTLVNEGEKWNATFGIHVNATESYSEAHAFSEDLLRMPPQAAWGWMNQAYYMNSQKDLVTGNVLDRLQELRADFPADSNMNWLYWDVYYSKGWEGIRFAEEAQAQGWRVGSEWAHAMPNANTWSHWANDENYGSTDKGLSSQLIRFMENSYRDTWNPDPKLSNANVVEFEGWTGHNDYNAFIDNVWERNLPTKFLQQSDIVQWTDNKIVLANGTTVESNLQSIDGTTIPTDRTITLADGTVVFTGGTYLLPWSDGGTDRLYYWNPTESSTQWTLSTDWKKYSTVKLYKLTDTGRTDEQIIPVTDGAISLPAGLIDGEKTAFVVYPGDISPQVTDPQWGQGSSINDPGFFSGTLDSYTTTGDVSIVVNERRNFQAELGTNASSISQEITVAKAGTYTVWAWVEIEPGKTRAVTVSAKGEVSPFAHQEGTEGNVSKTITASSALNATASDEKLGTYFQRVPLQIQTTKDNAKFVFSVSAEAGDAKVSVDDLRIVATARTDETLPDGVDAAKVVYYNNFESQDDGYWPFVTGSTNRGGDARTQLAERHEPYSQAGWYGVTSGVTEGGKYLDNVLNGQWSLMAHQENKGLILRTANGSLDLKKNHTYQVTFKYQAGFTADHYFVVGQDTAGSGTWKESLVSDKAIEQARGTGWKDSSGTPGIGTQVFTERFTVSTDNPLWFGIYKTGGNNQGDLVIDDLCVEDLGIIPTATMDWAPVASGDSDTQIIDITTTVALAEGNVSNVKHDLAVPEGWTATLVSEGTDHASADHPSVATWRLEISKGDAARDITFTGSWTLNSQEDSSAVTATIDPGNLPLINPNGGPDELRVISASSEQTSGEPAGSGVKEAAIDGDPNTYWHTQWSPTRESFPHEIVLQLTKADQPGAQCEITGFEYQARSSAANGRAKDFELYVSQNGEDWQKVELSDVAKARYANGLSDQLGAQAMEFATAYEGSYLKFVELNSINGNPFGGAAELRIGGTCTAPGSTPDPSVQPTVTPEPEPVPTAQPTPTPSPSATDEGTQTDPSPSATDEETQTDPSPSATDEETQTDPVIQPEDTVTPQPSPTVSDESASPAPTASSTVVLVPKKPAKLPVTGVGGSVGLTTIAVIAGAVLIARRDLKS